MKVIYEFKLPLILFFIGFLVRFFASMMKILHWQGADAGLFTGTIIASAAIIWIIIKLVLLKSVSK